MNDKIVALYTDGGVVGSSRSFVGGTWAWCHVNSNDEMIDSASGYCRCAGGWERYGITNNVMEMLAMIYGLESLPEAWDGNIYCDSEITLGRTRTVGKYNEWGMIGIPRSLRERLLASKNRLSSCVRYIHLGGHPTKQEVQQGFRNKDRMAVSVHNAFCDQECNRQKVLLASANRNLGATLTVPSDRSKKSIKI